MIFDDARARRVPAPDHESSSRLEERRSRPSPIATLLAARAPQAGVHFDAEGLGFYRFDHPAPFRKTAVLTPRLVVVGQGRKVGRFPGGELVYDEDHFLVITGETAFEGLVVDASPERPYLAMCMELPPELVAKALLALADATGAPSPPSARRRRSEAAAPEPMPAFVSELTPPFTDLLLRLLRTFDDPLDQRFVGPLVREELVFRLLRTDAAAILRGAVREGDVGVQHAMRYIRDNATRPLTVEAIARHVGMSPSHFAHRFSAIARVTPMRFLKRVRLERAREAMLARGLRVSEVALEVGYESASHFTRDFKLAYGTTPAEYLRRARVSA